MADSISKPRPKGPLGALKRPRYHAGDYLAHRDFRDEQRYLIQRLRRHNRHLHDWGVVCGLRVVVANESCRPWAVRVCPGYAIGPYGDEIEVPGIVVVDIADYLWLRPIDGASPAAVAYVAIRYAEEYAQPVTAKPPGCGCDDDTLMASRIRDGFQIDILWHLPETSKPQAFDLCAQVAAACPKCPDSPYVILAAISLPLSEGDPITNDRIDNRTFRREL